MPVLAEECLLAHRAKSLTRAKACSFKSRNSTLGSQTSGFIPSHDIASSRRVPQRFRNARSRGVFQQDRLMQLIVRFTGPYGRDHFEFWISYQDFQKQAVDFGSEVSYLILYPILVYWREIPCQFVAYLKGQGGAP
jgi:hypothetical protein